MKHHFAVRAVAAVSLVLVGLGCAAARTARRVPVTPAADAVFTATRQITALAVEADGTLWVGSSGGVLRRDPKGVWRKFTRLDGLPAHEVLGLALNDAGEAEVSLPRAVAVWRAEKWIIHAAPAPVGAPEPVRATWRGHEVEATPAGLRLKDGDEWRALDWPPSTGTHISALLEQDGVLRAALFGDGLWDYDGAKWQRAGLGLPPSAREITALAERDGVLWLGTRRNGVWRYDGKSWTNHLEPDEPFDHDAQFLCIFRGELWMSTLEDGLAIKTQRGWKHVAPPVISSDAPRHLVEFQHRLYVRHGSGTVDRFDGKSWKRDVFPWLPRKKAFALASDGRKLYIAQWGGWSEWDGQHWTHHLKLPQLQELPLMTLLPDGDTLWLGTQSRGLAEYSHKTNTLRWHDERAGLPDDWITSVARAGGVLFAGTFVGGLARREKGKWMRCESLLGRNATAMQPDGAGGLFIATRHGVQHWRAGVLRPLETSFVAPEAQALLRVPGGLWIGARTGLFFVRDGSSARRRRKSD
jgi:ligand-binding sensor domain-containing protein